jgi:hypothetical protein
MASLISIYVGGILTILMAVFHTLFHRLFKWEAENRKLTVVNQKIFFTIHLALLLFFFGTGIFTLFYARELSRSAGICFGINLIISLFWLWRTIWQIIYFKGKAMHYVLIVYFFLLFTTYFIPLILKSVINNPI